MTAKKIHSSKQWLMLGTHILLWLSTGDARLRAQSVELFQKAAQRGWLRLSVITLWEIAYLVSKNKISLSTGLSEFWGMSLEKL